MLEVTLAEMRRLGAEPIPVAELEARRTSLTGSFGRSAETTSGIAGLLANYILRGVGPEEIDRYLPAVLAVDPAEAQAAAAELLSPEGATLVIVGEASQFADALRASGRSVTIIPLAELNLDRPALR